MPATSPVIQQRLDWRRAETLRERALRLGEDAMHRGAPDQRIGETIDRWRAELSLSANEDYDQWLNRNGLDHERFTALLAVPAAETLDTDTPAPTWVAELSEAWLADVDEQSSEDVYGVGASTTARVLLTLAAPLIRRGVASLRRDIEALGVAVPFDPSTVHRLFLDSLGPRLLARVDRTLTLELHIARVEGRLRGDTPAERFASFGEVLADPDSASKILAAYPVLARQLTETVGQWTRYCLEFLRHLQADWSDIATCFSGGNDPGLLCHVDGGSGDPHRDGRSVQIVTFTSGLQLVYKPRRMSADAHFHDLLSWMNGRGFEPAFRIPALLLREGYGWSEFVAWSECRSSEEVQRFYERHGGLLALLYVLDATDMHRENLIASGEHPVIVDLEALFHPRPPQGAPRTLARQLGHDRMEHTVLRVGLLPQFGSGNGAATPFDSSALGGGGVQQTPAPVLHAENRGTDEMRFVRAHVQVPESKNLAKVDGQNVDVYQHRDTIIRGFERAYSVLVAGRDDLTAADGPIARFAEDEVRAVLRPTQTYMRVLQESGHPSLLGDAADHERLLQRLGTTLINRPYLEPVLRDEIADLQSGNVPIFTAQPGSRDLWTSRGVRIADYFDEPSILAVGRRIATLDDADLARQTWFIRAALTTLSRIPHESGTEPRRDAVQAHPQHPSEISTAGFERTAASIGTRLDQLAIRHDGLVSWIGITLANDKQWVLEPVGADLFAGTSGIALFLGYLDAVTGGTANADLARLLVRNAISEFATLDLRTAPMAWPVGPFAGWSGWMYTMSHLAQLWNDVSLLDAANRIRQRVTTGIERDATFDIIGGSAGLIGALASMHACEPSAEIRDDVVRCAEHLVQSARPATAGMAWSTGVSSRAPLTGYSHGASGMGSALLEAAAITGDDRYHRVAMQAFAYERAAFVHETGNWPDFREMSTGKSAADAREMFAWCHGAPGVGIARLRALELDDAPELRDDLELALTSTLARGLGPGGNHCLCHGLLGNADFVATAGRQQARPELTQKAIEVAAATVADLPQTGLQCGTPSGLEVPGLMTGIAGIGMGLLRLAAPDVVPSVLSLGAPPALARQRTGPSYAVPGAPAVRTW